MSKTKKVQGAMVPATHPLYTLVKALLRGSDFQLDTDDDHGEVILRTGLVMCGNGYKEADPDQMKPK